MGHKITSATFPALCVAEGLPEPVPEFVFAKGRKWAFDWAWCGCFVALEIEGGIYGRGKPCPVCKRKPVGAHSSIQRMLSDIEKYSEAAVLEWRVIRCVPRDFESGKVLAILKRAILKRAILR